MALGFNLVLEDLFNAIYLLNSISTKVCVVATQNSNFSESYPYLMQFLNCQSLVQYELQ